MRHPRTGAGRRTQGRESGGAPGWWVGAFAALLVLLGIGDRRTAQDRPPAAAPASAPASPDREGARDHPRAPALVEWDAAPRRPGLGGGQIALLAALVVAMTVLGGAAGYATSLFAQTQHAARAQLIVPLTEESPTGFLREDRNLTTQVVLLRSRAVVAPVAAEAGLTPEELTRRIRADVVDGSEVLSMEVRDPDARVALALARALTRRYLEAANAGVAGSRAYLEGQLSRVQRRLDRATPGSAAEAELVARRTSLLERLDGLALAGPPARVLTAPYAVPDPVSPRPWLSAAAGALSALLITAAVAGLLGRRWARR